MVGRVKCHRKRSSPLYLAEPRQRGATRNRPVRGFLVARRRQRRDR
jgi:hypothetical protein